MPENPIYSQSGGFQDSRDQRFIDESALGSMKEPVAASLKNIVENNPHLTQDPSLLGGFAHQNGLNSTQISNAVQYLTMYGGIKEHAINQGQSDPNASHGPGFWSSLWHSTASMWDHAANATKDVANFWTNPNSLPNAAESIGKGVLSFAKDTGKFVEDINNRVGMTGAELATLGLYGPKGWNTNFSGLADAFDTTKNVIDTAGNMVNPWSSGNIFMLMSHNMAFYNSLAKRYGWGYAIGYAAPALAAGFATDGAFSAADVGATAAEDAAMVQSAGEAFRAGRTLSEEDQAAVKAAASRQMARMKQDAAQEVAQGQRAGRVAQLNRSMRATAKTLEYATKPLGGVIRVAKAIGKPMTDVKLNTMYAITQATAQKNPALAAIWNDPNVRNGVAIDQYGHPMGTNGQMIASYFGMDKGNMFFSPVSGLTDFYTKWLGTDPLGAYGKVLGQSRSFGGFTGRLGAWFGGLGIRGADSIDIAASQYRRVRKAFEYMATHSANEIADTFRNTYIDDAKKGIKASDIISQLGEAKSVEEVMQIHRDIAESVAMTKSMVPTLSMYEVTKAALKGKLSSFGTAGNLLGVDGKFLEQISSDAGILKDTGGIPIKPQTELNYADNNLATRSLNSFARWLETRFTRSQMYIDELTNKVENSVIRPGSVNAIPAIMDFLRASLLPENVVKSVGDLLLQTKNPHDYISVYRHAMYHAVMRRATAGLNHDELATFIGTSSDHIWNEVVKMTGLDGGGAVGLYAAGINGADISAIVHAESGIEAYAGIGMNHLGELRFPRAAELRGLASKIRGVSLDFAKTESAKFSRTQDMTIKQLQMVVDFHNPRLAGLDNQLERIGKVSTGSLESQGARDPFRFQNANQEEIIHAKDGWGEASSIRYDLEGAGDIFRELAQSGNKMYIDEKVRRLQNLLDKHFSQTLRYGDSIKPAIATQNEKVQKLRALWEAQPTTTEAQKIAVDLNLAILNNDMADAQNALNKIKNLEDEGTGWVKDSHTNAVEKNPSLENKAITGYNKAKNDIQQIVKEAHTNPDLIDAQRFTTAYDALRVEKANLQRSINALSEVIQISKAKVGEEVYAQAVDEIMATYPNINVNTAHDVLTGLKGQITAYEDALRQMEVRMTSPARPIEEVRKDAQEYIKATKTKAEADKILKEQFNEQIEKWHAEKNPYTPTFQKGVDGLNRFLSKTFVPLALFSGGWALRVSASEATLNSLRFGGWASFDAKVTQAIAKHEVYGAKLITAAGKSERTLIRDVVAGALLGIERNLIKGFDQARRDRMLEDFVGTIMRHDGHLPGGVHDVGETVFNDNTLKTALLKTTVGLNDKGESVLAQAVSNKSFESKNIGSVGYAKALRMNIASGSTDALLQPTFGRLADIMFARGEEKTGELLASHMTWRDIHNAGAKGFVGDQTGRWEAAIGAGAKDFRKPEQVLALRDELRKGALQDIKNMDPAERARFARDTGRMKTGPLSGANAHEDWANAIVEHVMASVSGLDSRGNTIFHSTLVDQAATGNIKDEMAFAADVKKMSRGAEPKHIPAPGGVAHDALGSASATDFLKNISQKGHDKILGPIVNRLVREPIFLLEHHNAMEALRGMVNGNIIDEATAQVVADQRAMTNMIKYVHNPKDKTMFEVNMRVAAPFYFAQNQAWRRAFRVLHENPGAFEKYLKLSLGVTNYISNLSAGGAYPSIAIPGATFMGVAGVMGANIPAMGGDASPFTSLGFGLAADPGSVASVFPTGAQSGFAGLLGLARPSWGPLVTIPVKLVEKLYGTDTNSLAKKMSSAFLGPIAQSSSMQSDFFPSTIGRNLLDSATSIASAFGATDLMSTAQISAQNSIMNNAVDNLFKQQYNKVFNNTDFTGVNSWTGKPWTKDEIVTYCRGNAELEITKLFNDHTYYQDFLDRAKAAAVTMMLVKSVIAFGTPVAVSLNDQFSKTKEFSAIQNSINPDTKNKYTFAEAATKFGELYPYNVLDLTAHSMSTYATYPETSSAVKILTNHPEITKAYPNAAAYLIDRNSTYDAGAYTLEMSLGLRSRQAPQDYLNSLLVSAGNDYYYNYLATQPEFGGNGDVAGQSTTSTQWNALKTAAQAYGNSTNPTWLASFNGGQKHDIEIKAYNEMTKMLADPNVSKQLLPKTEKDKFQNILGQYNQVIGQVKGLIAAGDKTDASAVESAWYNWVTDEATNNPYWAKQSYFMTSVLRGLPTKGL